jgi:hypothetical protein
MAAVVLAALAVLAFRAPAVAQAIEAALFRDVDNPAYQPFQAGSTGRVWGPGRHPSVIAKVPEGKRLVIEYVSAWLTDIGEDEFLEISTVLDGKPLRHMVPIARKQEAAGFTQHIAGQQVRLYADPGTEVIAAVHRDGLRDGVEISVAISGHLVNLP